MFYFVLDFYKKEVIVSSMKPTQKNTISYVKQMLSTNKVWATKALVRIYQENQTADEQMAKTEAKMEELNADIAKMTAKIVQASASSATLKSEVQQMQGELAELTRARP